MPRLVVGALVLSLGALFAPPALAANKTVTIQGSDNVFAPDRVAIQPGDTVTWSNPGTFENHNVHFEDESFVMPSPPTGMFSVTHLAFTNPGAYRYYCEVHGAPGGVGMSGVVYVNATGTLPPNPQFAISPSAPVAGQVVTFNASTSMPTTPERPITTYEWDLDGNGTFEQNTGATPTTTMTYLTAGNVNVRLRVTDSQRLSDVRTRAIAIDPAPAPPPQPDPTPSPQPDPTPSPQPGPAPQPAPTPAPQPAPLSSLPAAPFQPQPVPSTRPKAAPRRPAGKCSKLKGSRRSACIKRYCGKLKGAKKRACVTKVTRKASAVSARP